ncbi:MAG: L-glutamate gamma-semialdehyde dehydrogenase [Armatimonadetes bacterium]|nr:L-glutamate gamma-semialdehyde dehydrogenase [Armatimonadota bacterium]
MLETTSSRAQAAALAGHFSGPSGSEALYQVPTPFNEPVRHYAPGSPERAALKKALEEMSSREIEVPLVIGGELVKTGDLADIRMPHRHVHLLGRFHKARPEHVEKAIEAALAAAPSWAAMPWTERAAIFLKAAELLAGPYRCILNAATMLGQSKTAHQAEIDSACELIDFLRFNPFYMQKVYQEQPQSTDATWNRMEHRPLEGFVFAVTPFNFTAIAGNLPSAPAMMGNVVVWKPASTAVLSAHYIMEIFERAGLPPGVINLVPGSGSSVGDTAIASPHLAGVHFTGSTRVFQGMWKHLGDNIARYRTYPRIVGETGGKDFVLAHPSAPVEPLATALLRGAFEFQGQKCSAASRAYIPDNLWPQVKERLLAELATVKVGDVGDFRNFMGAVIDAGAYENIKGYIDYARSSKDAEILTGGSCDDSAGYFIEPTVVQVTDPHHRLMEEEIFGPVLTLYVYPQDDFEGAMGLIDTTSPYALTGAIFATDRGAIVRASSRLRHAAGNFYVNDKPTGAIVSQQPFGGARGSGTNDKAGSVLNLIRWVSPRSIKETFVPCTDYRYPFMSER